MAIQLARKNPNPGEDGKMKVSTISTNKIFRMSRLKDDLDRAFIEETTKQDAAGIGMKYVDLYGFPIDTSHISMIPRDLVNSTKMGVFSLNNKELYIATSSPNYNGQKAIIDSFIAQDFKIHMFLCSFLSLNKLDKTFDHIIDIVVASDEINIDLAKVARIKNDVKSLTKMNEVLNKVSLSDFIETVLIGALENKASDIHFEPEKDSYHLRLRLDGVLYNFAQLPTERKKDRKSTRLNSSHVSQSRMPSSA